MKPDAARRVAVIFDNFGPYHIARVEAAAKLMPVAGIELSGVSADYEWQNLPHDSGWEKRTVVTEGSCRHIPQRELALRLASLLDEISPLAVAIPGWSMPGSQIAVQWCGRRRVPAVVMSESCAHDEVRKPLQEAIKTRILSLYSAALVGGSAHVEYMHSLGMPRERIFTGYDAIDNRYFSAGADSARQRAAELRRELDLPERYFLASSRFIAKKNLFTVIAAFASFLKESPAAAAWKLVILGDGVLAGEIRARIDELGLRDSVRLPGFQQYPALPIYYGLASAFIHASTTEQWGLVVNEAMAAGLPVLVSERCGCAADLVRNKENGFTFNPADTVQLSRLMGVLAEVDNREEMGAASRRIVETCAPARFGEGLQSAVSTALEADLPRASFVTRTLLRGLSRRSAAPPKRKETAPAL